MTTAHTYCELTESERLARALADVDLSLERRLEKRLLYAWLDAIPHRKESVLFLTGASDTGKSQLTRKVSRRSVRRGYVVGQSSVVVSNGPYGVIVDAIRELMDKLSEEHGCRNLEAYIETRPGLQDLLGVGPACTQDLQEHPRRGKEDITRGALFRELGRVIRMISKGVSTSSLRRPVLMILEDTHLAQAETIDLLRFLADFCSNDPIGFLVVATGRERIVEAIGEAQTELGRRGLAKTVFLDGFDDHQTDSLIRKVFRRNRFSFPLRRLLRQSTEGNPTSTIQTLWLLKQTCSRHAWTLRETLSNRDLPASPPEAAAERIVAKRNRTQALLFATAVLGRSADENDVLALLDWDHKRLLSTLSDLHTVYPALHREDEGWLTFSTESLHEAIYESIPTNERNVLHRLAADRLEKRGNQALDERVAGHLEAAGFAEEALPFRTAAGDRALHFCSPGRAATNFGHALQTAATDKARRDVRFELLLKTASALASTKCYDEAVTHLVEAVEQAKQSCNLEWEADAKKRLGKIAAGRRELGGALACYDQSLALYRACGNESGQCDVLLKTSRVYLELGMWDQLGCVYEDAFRLAQANQNNVQVAAISMNVAIMHSLRV